MVPRLRELTPPVARGSQEAGIKQPKAHLLDDPCIFLDGSGSFSGYRRNPEGRTTVLRILYLSELCLANDCLECLLPTSHFHQQYYTYRVTGQDLTPNARNSNSMLMNRRSIGDIHNLTLQPWSVNTL